MDSLRSVRRPTVADDADGTQDGQVVRSVPISSLSTTGSPRLDGVDAGHVRRLVECIDQLPPITVHLPSMRVIDGAHRVQAARECGHTEIEARFFSGGEFDSFVLAVRSNIAHGLPLSLADRAAAATRIIADSPQWSDRAIAGVAGLSHQMVAQIRRRATGPDDQLHARVGLDGKVRPLSTARGRELAAAVIASDPDASLRQVARTAGISVGTVRNVRERLRRGEDPALPRQRGARDATERDEPVGTVPADPGAVDVSTVLHNLRNDPSLRFNDVGRRLLRMLGSHPVLVAECCTLARGIPDHCRSMVSDVAHEYAAIWLRFAKEIQHHGEAPARPDALAGNT